LQNLSTRFNNIGNNIDVIEECRLFFDFLLPIKMLEIRTAKFKCKLMNCNNVLNYFGLHIIV